MRAFGTAALAVTLSQVSGLRKGTRTESEVKLLTGGVPIHNYNLRHLQYDGPTVEGNSTDYDWIVVFKDGNSDIQMMDFCGGEEGRGSCNVMGHPSYGGVGFAAIRGSEEKLEKLLDAHPGLVEFAEPDLAVFTIPELPSTSSSESDHWGLDRMNKQRAQQTGAGVHIYVMDTGTRTSHAEFGGRGIPTIDTIAGNGNAIECANSNDPTCGQDTHGHGTHTAGSAAGSNNGVATGATVHGMRVCCGRGTNTLAGLDWIARNAEKPALVTMSLGSMGQSQASKRAVEKVVENGIAVFVSAGNNNIDSCRKTYAFIDATITVGASDEGDNRARFSNFGSCNDIYAPGTNIPSASHRSDDGIVGMSGTSMATPLAAGAGALLLERDPNMSPEKLKKTMIEMATEGALGDMKQGDPNLLVNVR